MNNYRYARFYLGALRVLALALVVIGVAGTALQLVEAVPALLEASQSKARRRAVDTQRIPLEVEWLKDTLEGWDIKAAVPMPTARGFPISSQAFLSKKEQTAIVTILKR